MKTFNETQMCHPWAWCQDILEKHDFSSKMVSDTLSAPRSTVRALMGGKNAAPRYELLCGIIKLCIDLENGLKPYVVREARNKKANAVAPEQPVQHQDPLDDPNIAQFDFL